MIVGMDFGTTNSGMSVYDGRHLTLIPLDSANENPRVARTALYITNQRRVHMGRDAIEKYYEQNINRKVKYQRVWVGEITLSFAELPEWVRDISIEKDVLAPGRLFLSFKTGLKSSTYVGTTVGSHFYFLEDIVALYLYVARLRAEEFLGTDLKRIVLGRPVHFATDAQGDQLAEQRLVHAAFRAGYEEVYLQYEPIAAAHFYETSIDREEHALIFDFGGGTLDITVARLGDPANREILASGGIPIAGDIFDQMLVRHKLPYHFGEGTHYTGDRGQRRPVPANFFDAFSDWQELLELNKPDILDYLDRLRETSDRQRRIDMLIALIRSSYSLKMFDAVEAAKRELSSTINARILLDGPGFRVHELVARQEFERLIAAETQAIADVLDDVLTQAGLRPDQIDAVIRTGGSSQIPAFIDLLGQRFGPEKVRAIDTFSSVTSGLGILGHHLATGAANLKCYRRDEWHYGTHLREGSRHGTPPVDLDLMKKFIDVEENQPDDDLRRVCILTVTDASRVTATTQPRRAFDGTDLLLDTTQGEMLPGIPFAAAPEDRVLLMTSEYRFFLRETQAIADLGEIDLSLAELEGFFKDQFGRERLSGMVRWADLLAAERLALVSSAGQVKVMRADALLPSLDQLHPYRLDHLSGAPVALVPADAGRELITVTSSGGVARLNPAKLRIGAQRLLKLRSKETVIGAVSMTNPGDMLLMAANGCGVRIHTRAIPFDDSSTLVLARRTVRGFAVLTPGADIWASTTRRLSPVDASAFPLNTPQRFLHLKKDEELVGLHTL
ncbi:MAG: Hsp70 family protein [Anaerolineae bacterium]|nr:Hsp70 family protein [Anaerolineae bacterium]